MSVTVIFGGQAGSEGKGKFVGYLARKEKYDAAVCNFYTNAGHTWVSDDGKKHVMVQQIPQACVEESTKLYVGSASGITLKTMLDEINNFGVADRLFIHPRAMMILPKHKEQEECLNHISSTKKGCGAAQVEKIMRGADVILAGNVPELKPYMCQTEVELNDLLDRGGDILIEGSQGFDLDLNFGYQYPYTTSRQTHAGQAVADCGIPVTSVTDIIAVIRCHPIRVGNQFDDKGNKIGTSGPLGGKELTWEEITAMSGSPEPLLERTTVTQKVRRIFEMDFERLHYMVRVNGVTQLALNFINYINYADTGVNTWEALSQKSKDFVAKVEEATGVPVTLIGTGARDCDIIDLRSEKVW